MVGAINLTRRLFMNNIFSSKRGIRGLVVLLIGFILLAMMGLYSTHYYNEMTRTNISFSQAKRDVISYVVVAKRLKKKELGELLSRENKSWLYLTVDKIPLNGVSVIDINNIWQVHQVLQQQVNKIELSLKLHRHGYLNIQGTKPDQTWLTYGFIFSIVMLLLLLFILCWWVIHYISTPLQPLERAVSRLAYDIKAPAIAEVGSDEMKAVIRAFNLMQANIRRLLDDRTYMLAAISHDLRTPITRLRLRAESIDDSALYTKIVNDLDEMETMISSILAFTRQQNTDETLKEFDLVELIHTLQAGMQAQKDKVTVSTSLQSHVYYGRFLSLKRAFSNVIENAIKYGESCHIEIMRENKMIKITVHDKGAGIEKDKLEKVFEPFYRVDTARTPTKPGSGLGLAITKEAIFQAGGSIHLENDKGLKVTIALPLMDKRSHK